MVKVDNLKPVRKTSHLVQTEDAWGTHDSYFFTPFDQDLVLRHPACSNLMANDFTSEGFCPNCHAAFSKAEALDMYVEAKTVKVNHGKYNKEIMDLIGGFDVSVVVPKNLECYPVNDVARNRVAASVAANRTIEGQRVAEKRQRIAEKSLIDQLRSQGPVGEINRL